MPIEVVYRYSRKMLRDNPNKLFIFGDNCRRIGKGGQAKEARGEPNAIGICTKKAPTYQPEDFFTDDELIHNIKIICDDFGPVVDALKAGKTVVWPEDGIGTGIARLSVNGPLTLSIIEAIIGNLKRLYN